MDKFKLEENCKHFLQCKKFGTAYCPCDFFEEKEEVSDSALEDGFWNGTDIDMR